MEQATRQRAWHMLFLGYGFCAASIAPLLHTAGWQLSATCRTPEKAARLQAQGIATIMLDTPPRPSETLLPEILPPATFDGVSHVLVSVPPDADGDPVLPLVGEAMVAHATGVPSGVSGGIQWIGYLSTTGVYGDHQGAWIDEGTPPGPIGIRGQRRVAAERQWLDFGAAHHISVNLFRLAGIYGAGRNQLRSVKAGTARRINKPGQVFSRIHVDDIAATVLAAIRHSRSGGISARAYSVCDDAPAPPHEVVAFAAALLGVVPPPLIDFEQADLSPMARSFYSENKRIHNDRIKDELGVSLKYPNYREGLTALVKTELEAGSF